MTSTYEEITQEAAAWHEGNDSLLGEEKGADGQEKTSTTLPIVEDQYDVSAERDDATAPRVHEPLMGKSARVEQTGDDHAEENRNP